MFTGLVETKGEIVAVQPDGPGVRLVIDAKEVAEGVALGDSISISGCCLTVVEIDGSRLAFQAGDETLKRTILGGLSGGDEVNLERSLRVGDRMGGHFVTGHVDGVGSLVERIDDDDWSTLWFEAPGGLTREMASKGSITVDGVSLTLVDVEGDRFSVALIPHTLEVTTLGRGESGTRVNLETDVLAKYVARQLSGD